VLKQKKANTAGIVAAVMGGLGVLVILVLALRPKDESPKDKGGDPAAETGGTGGLSSDTGTPEPAETPTATTPPGPAAGDPLQPTKPTAEDGSDDDSGIKGSASTAPSGVDALRAPPNEVFIEFPVVEGTTEEEAETLRTDVRLLVDRDSGIDGNRAQTRLEKAGKKAIPVLLSYWQGKTFDNEAEQWAGDKVQRVLRAIVKHDGPTWEFMAVFVPHEPIGADKFERAGRLWVQWWLGEGINKERFAWREE
jgi:hypothetical protein